MFSAGLMAALGISDNSLHIVIGAMLIAPGFEPISRFMMALITKHKRPEKWCNGHLKGYFTLICGGAAGALLIKVLGKDVLPGTSSYLPLGSLVQYWTGFSSISIVVSVIAALAGGIIIMSNKSLLTAGVMVALALIPSAVLTGMRLIEGDFTLAGETFLRLLVEIVIIAIFTGLIFLWKRLSTHKRDMHI